MKVKQGLSLSTQIFSKLRIRKTSDSPTTTQPGKHRFETLAWVWFYDRKNIYINEKWNELHTGSYASPPFFFKYTHLLSPGHPHSPRKQIRTSWERDRGSRILPHCQACDKINIPTPHFSLYSTTQLFLYCLLRLLPNFTESSRNVNSHDRRNEE